MKPKQRLVLAATILGLTLAGMNGLLGLLYPPHPDGQQPSIGSASWVIGLSASADDEEPSVCDPDIPDSCMPSD